MPTYVLICRKRDTVNITNCNMVLMIETATKSSGIGTITLTYPLSAYNKQS